MTSFRQFMAVPVIALFTLLTFSACNDDDTPNEVGGKPTVTLGEAVASRAGIAIPVQIKNATEISYAAMFKAADATEDPIPTATDFKTVKVADLTDNTVLIPAADLAEFGTYVIYTYVTNKEAQSEQQKISVVYNDESFTPQLAFEVRNMTPYTLDVKVDINKTCGKYVATVIRKSAYTEAYFIESAQKSISPSKDDIQYGTQSYVVYDASATIPETKLSKDTRYDSDECNGVLLNRFRDVTILETYIIAIYAVDKFGNGEVYTSEEPFTLPEARVGTAPTIEITPTATYTGVTAGFTATGECAKLVDGATFSKDKPDAFWEETNKAEILAYLSSLPFDMAVAYTGNTVTKQIDLTGKPGDKFVLYSMGITADGQIGPMSYKIVPLKMPSLDGAASITSIDAVSVVKNLIKWKVTPSSNATKVRILVGDKESFEMTYGSNDAELNWVMTTDESPNGYGWWVEMTKEELAATDNIYSINASWTNTPHVIRAIAQDAEGKWGAIKVGPDQTTDAEEGGGDEDLPIDITNGTGEITLNISSQEVDPETGESVNATYTITRGANTEVVYKLGFSDDSAYTSYDDFTAENILASCQPRFTTNQLKDNIKAVNFDAEYTEYGLSLPSKWGSGFSVFITKDTSGNYKIAAVLIPNKPAFYPGK